MRRQEQEGGLAQLGLALALIAFCASAAADQSSQPLHKLALVIGNAHYASVEPLKNPENDAHDMCSALESIGFETSCTVDVDTRVRMRSLIEDFVERAPPRSVAFVYYAGHAVQVNDANYLIPTKANLTDERSLPGESVALSFLMQQLNRLHATVLVVALDACRNNPLSSSGRKLAQGLADVTDIPNNSEVWYATAANKPALDGIGRNGTFTKHLLAHLHDSGTVDDLFKHVQSDVELETQQLGFPQKPLLNSVYTGKYCLVQCDNVAQLEVVNDQLKAQQRKAEIRLAETSADAARKSAENEKMKKEQQEAKKRQQDSRVPPAF